jgi:hypothetical protein
VTVSREADKVKPNGKNRMNLRAAGRIRAGARPAIVGIPRKSPASALTLPRVNLP